jgi:hypothetical protein
MASSYVIRILALASLDIKQQLEFWRSLYPSLIKDKGQLATLDRKFSRYREIGRKKKPTIQDLRWRDQFKTDFAASWPRIRDTFTKIALDAGAEGIVRAYQSGIIDLYTFAAVDTPDMVKEYVEVVSSIIDDGSTYPLLDDQTGSLVRAGINEGLMKVSEVSVARGKHIGLVGRLLQELPLFDLASVDEILDIRRELDRPLVHFRSGMIRFSENVKAASWDEDFSAEVRTVYVRDVEPGVREIEEAVKSNSYLRSLARKLIDTPQNILGGSVLGLVVSPLSNLPFIVSGALGAGLGAAIAAYDAHEEVQEKQAKLEQNQLFFYYKAGEQLVSNR